MGGVALEGEVWKPRPTTAHGARDAAHSPWTALAKILRAGMHRVGSVEPPPIHQDGQRVARQDERRDHLHPGQLRLPAAGEKHLA